MILEIRIAVVAAAVALASSALIFLPWQVVLPVFGLAYLAYKLRYYRSRIGVYEADPDAIVTPGQWLSHAALGTVALLGLTRVLIFRLLPPVWTTETLEVPQLVLTDIPTLIEQLVPLGVAWGAVAGPPLLLSFAGGQFRQRLLPGVDSRGAAARAALWETLVRVPVYVLWVGLMTLEPVLRLWAVVPRVLGGAVGLSVDVGDGFAPLLGDVFFTVVAVGHAAPLVALGAYYVVYEGKYSGWTIPEVLGYRGLYPPSRASTVGNVVVPVVTYLVYAVPVLALTSGLARAGLVVLLPAAVATLAGADLRGWTTRLSRAELRRVPGVAGDAVAVGLVLGLYAVAALVVAGLGLGLSVGDALGAFLLFPVVAAPLGYAANRLTGLRKRREVAELVDRIDADPGAGVADVEIDRLLAYVHARDDDLRAEAVGGLATAAGVSTYRQSDAVEVFVDALLGGTGGSDRPTDGDRNPAVDGAPAVLGSVVERLTTPMDRFVRPALRGLVTTLRDGPGVVTAPRLLDTGVLGRIESYMRSADQATRAVSTEAFAWFVVAGYRADRGTAPPLDELDGLPVGAIESVVESEATDPDVTDAAVECFAVLWYHRDDLGSVLTDADERRLLVDLVDWSARAGEDARARAVFAITHGPAVVDAADLDRVFARLTDDDPIVRFIAAHVLRSSMAEHADRIEPDRLIALLEDSDPAALGPAEATVLRALADADIEGLSEHAPITRLAAAALRQGGWSVAVTASELLATTLAAYPTDRHEKGVVDAIETGLEHDLAPVRASSVRAATTVVAAAPSDGRPFVGGLAGNLDAPSPVGEAAVSALQRVLDEYPAYGTEVIADLAAGLGNQATIKEQYAGAMVVGRTVADVTAGLVADVTERGVRGGEPLVDPLVELAGVTGGSTRESIFRALANLAPEYPDAAREALSVAATALDEGNARVRRDAGRVLTGVATSEPAAIQRVVEDLIVAIDDADPQTRATALHALDLIAADDPTAVDETVRRVIGRLDDDSAVVRERAAELVMTLTEREPGLVEPAAQASDRLRRLQRDPAVDVDAEDLQAAATAVQTGSPTGEASDVVDDDTAIWTPDPPEEVGSSDDTRVFDPASDDASDRIPEGTCSTCGADLIEIDEPGTCPECGAALDEE